MMATNDNSNPQQGNPFLQQQKMQQQKMQQMQTMQQQPVTSHTRRVFNVPPSKKDERKLFVGGLPSNITEDEFREFFEGFGKLVDSVVMFDRETGRSRGFGFVTFEDPTICHKLLVMGNEGIDSNTDIMKLIGKVEMQGKVCEIKAATPKANTMRGNGSGGRRGDGSNKRLQHQKAVPYADSDAGFAPYGQQGVGPIPPAMPMYHGYSPAVVNSAAVYYPPPPYMSHLAIPVDPYMTYPPMSAGPPSLVEVPPPHNPIGAAIVNPHLVHEQQYLQPAAAVVSPGPALFPPIFGMPPPVVYGAPVAMPPLIPMENHHEQPPYGPDDPSAEGQHLV